MTTHESDARVDELNKEIANLLREHRRFDITITQLMGSYAGRLDAPKGSVEQRYATARDDLLAATHLDKQIVGRELAAKIKERTALQEQVKESKREQADVKCGTKNFKRPKVRGLRRRSADRWNSEMDISPRKFFRKPSTDF